MRLWLVVIEDPESEFTDPAELDAMLRPLLEGAIGKATVADVRRGGLLARKVREDLPPVRHKLMGRPRE